MSWKFSDDLFEKVQTAMTFQIDEARKFIHIYICIYKLKFFHINKLHELEKFSDDFLEVCKDLEFDRRSRHNAVHCYEDF